MGRPLYVKVEGCGIKQKVCSNTKTMNSVWFWKKLSKSIYIVVLT